MYRYDRGALLRSHVRPDGTLLVEGFAAREGIYEYRDAAGRVTRELVTLDALRTGAATLGRAAVTLGHPAEDVSPDTYQRDAVGDVDGNVAIESGGFVRVQMAVRRKDAIQAVQAGTVELSPGYRTKIDPTPGTHPVHGRYDARQVERTTNHLAIVDTARGGPEMRFRTDGAWSSTVVRMDTGAPAPSNTGSAPGGIMNPALVRLLAVLGITSRVDSDAAAIEAIGAAVEGRRADSAEVQKKLEAEKARADKAEADLKKAQDEVAKLQKAESDRADAADRTKLEAAAKALNVDPAKHASTPELRKAIATAHMGGTLRADASDEYIRFACDAAAAKLAEDGAGRSAGSEVWAPGNAGTNRDDAAKAGGNANTGTQPRTRRGPSALSRQHAQQAFEGQRKGGS